MKAQPTEHHGMVRSRCVLIFVLVTLSTLFSVTARANGALLLFDGEKGRTFAGCLNCLSVEEASVCNPVGDYGSPIGDKSIWNPVGDFGSVVETNSPWNPAGEGLRILDANGNYYGRFTISPIEQSTLPIIRQIISAFITLNSTNKVRDLLCGH